jgi:hypothetical protein
MMAITSPPCPPPSPPFPPRLAGEGWEGAGRAGRAGRGRQGAEWKNARRAGECSDFSELACLAGRATSSAFHSLFLPVSSSWPHSRTAQQFATSSRLSAVERIEAPPEHNWSRSLRPGEHFRVEVGGQGGAPQPPMAPQTRRRLTGAFWRLVASLPRGREVPLTDSSTSLAGHVPTAWGRARASPRTQLDDGG